MTEYKFCIVTIALKAMSKHQGHGPTWSKELLRLFTEVAVATAIIALSTQSAEAFSIKRAAYTASHIIAYPMRTTALTTMKVTAFLYAHAAYIEYGFEMEDADCEKWSRSKKPMSQKEMDKMNRDQEKIDYASRSLQ